MSSKYRHFRLISVISKLIWIKCKLQHKISQNLRIATFIRCLIHNNNPAVSRFTSTKLTNLRLDMENRPIDEMNAQSNHLNVGCLELITSDFNASPMEFPTFLTNLTSNSKLSLDYNLSTSLKTHKYAK